MNEKGALIGNTRGSFRFFPTNQPNYILSSSLFLNFFKIFSFLTFLDVIFAKGSLSNPYAFMQGNCCYSLTTTPLIDSEGRYRTWSAFESMANELINGTAGAITQLNHSISAPTIWKESICYVDFLLQSNCAKENVASFLNEFKQMINNDTAVDAARKCLDGSLLIKICLGIIAAILLIGCVVCTTYCIKDLIKDHQRRHYQSLEDGGQRLEQLKS